MANLFNQNPIILDTQMAAPYSDATNAGKLFSRMVYKIYWFNPTASGDDAVITDGVSGKVLVELQAEGPNKSQVFNFDPPKFFKDFQLSTLTTSSGKIYIYYNQP